MRDGVRTAEPAARVTRRFCPGRAGEEATPEGRAASELLIANRRFYDALWRDARLVEPERFNTWPLARSLAAPARRRLEVAPGLRPRLPIEGTQFLDISAPALMRLRQRGANAVLGLVTSIPFPDGAFELVCALDIVEHVANEDEALGELSRVAAPGAALLLSVPLHPSRWNAFDEFVGHQRRYEPERLIEMLAEYGFSVERSAAYGMQPRSSHLLDLGMWFLVNRRDKAMWWYNHVLMPLGMRFQKKLVLRSGVLVCDEIDEILLVCRKADSTHAMT